MWLDEGTWEACVDAAREIGGDITLMHVVDVDTEAAMSGSAGLLGRVSGADPAELLAAAERRLLRAASERLDRTAETITLRGRPEREVLSVCAGADLLILARDGDRTRLGPRSIGHRTRFVIDHAPCRILLVWPSAPPSAGPVP
ncbi:universal stress protein [Actinoplanes sp. NPDC049548]|uniref:universal stress protein n=1 Tax=Actinoplanes sp. NPDC049548 TaxID=3155152 RepID=UPI003417A272